LRIKSERGNSGLPQLVEKPSVFDSDPVLLVPRKLETAQNRKVRAARAKPVLPQMIFLIY